ncbi:protein kinase-like protein [Nocardioides sp. J9]|uniref:serine/threonine-protein kinase n=1 Tax=Nocardioides sp. J9 TaxID=935844 RepID=UPI00119DACAC|nr:serine/threonine-protein kinase [Nocardioides sp. J9]TWH00795.1 protein kinase-like protein [Nocardioides sp. J9]
MPVALREPPDQIGPYRLVRRLGQGGMGAVYDAVDTALDRRVAVKVVLPALLDDPGLRQRFGQEARLQASLDSPHVVRVLAHGEADGWPYLVTPLVPDGDLGRHLRRHGPLPEVAALELVAQVADGLAEAHRAGLVHRDVKPSNVLLRHRGTDTLALLSDFGIATPIRDGGVAEGVADGVADDVRALGRLLEATLGGPLGRRLGAALDAARSAAEVRDLLRTAAARTDRSRLRGHRTTHLRPRHGRWVVGAAAAAAVVAVVVLVAPPAEGPGERTAEPVVDQVTRTLRSGGLQRPAAECTAQALVTEHGPAAAEHLAAPRPDPHLTSAALDAAVRCLWTR